MKGPAPAPTKLKLLKGVRPSRINKKEPKPKAVSSGIPKGWAFGMSPIARRYWKQIAPILKENGLLTEIDLYTLRILSETYSDYIRLGNLLKKEGETYETTNAQKEKVIKERPEVETRIKARKDYLAYLQQFGMSPSSRTRIKVDIREAKKNKDLDF